MLVHGGLVWVKSIPAHRMLIYQNVPRYREGGGEEGDGGWREGGAVEKERRGGGGQRRGGDKGGDREMHALEAGSARCMQQWTQSK